MVEILQRGVTHDRGAARSQRCVRLHLYYFDKDMVVPLSLAFHLHLSHLLKTSTQTRVFLPSSQQKALEEAQGAAAAAASALEALDLSTPKKK